MQPVQSRYKSIITFLSATFHISGVRDVKNLQNINYC